MNSRKRYSVVAVVAIFALLGGAILGGTADAKKKKGTKKAKTVTVTKAVNAPVPDAIGNGVDKVLNGKLDTILTVGKQAKGKTVGSVAVTFQTTGLAAGAANDLDFTLTAPDGTSLEFEGGLGGQSIGPLTEQPNSPVRICSFNPATQVPPPPPCVDPNATLNPPYLGTAGNPFLNLFKGVNEKGNWHFEVQDTEYAVPPETPQTSILNSVTLKLTPQKPVV